METKEQTFEGGITVFYKIDQNETLYLVVENRNTGNVTLVSGAKEDSDSSNQQAARRENEEELGIRPDQYTLIPTTIRHEFIFGPKKIERAGHRGSYQIFLCDLTNVNSVFQENSDIVRAVWLKKEEVLNSLTFDDLKEVFLRAVREIEKYRENEQRVESRIQTRR